MRLGLPSRDRGGAPRVPPNHGACVAYREVGTAATGSLTAQVTQPRTARLPWPLGLPLARLHVPVEDHAPESSVTSTQPSGRADASARPRLIASLRISRLLFGH